MSLIKFLATGNGFLFFTIFLFLIILIFYFLFKKSKFKKYTGNILLIIFYIFTSLFFYILTFSFPTTQGVGPRIIPRLWVIILVPLSIYILIRIFNNIEIPDPVDTKSKLTIIFILLIILYLVSMQYIGYYLSSFLFLSITMYLLGNRKYLNIIFISTGWLLFSYLAFYKLLYVPLPIGKIFEYFIY